jgi:hypothetical protein
LKQGTTKRLPSFCPVPILASRQKRGETSIRARARAL